jgi:hypothetical protein
VGLAPGPYTSVEIEPGVKAPFYTIRFDKQGRSESPLSQKHLMEKVPDDSPTDIFVFCHGWNNDWATALGRYEDFIGHFQGLRRRHDLKFDRPYRPVLVGIFWPSAALVLPGEQGPDIAGTEEGTESIDLDLARELADSVGDGELDRFYELIESESLDEAEGTELLRLVSGVFAGGDPDLIGDPHRDIEEMLASWAKLDATFATPDLPDSPDDFGAVGTRALTEPDAAGFLGKLNPRNLLRGLTVWQMKDRAGVIGTQGVGPMLRDLLNAGGAGTRLHLVGHSYGGRVLLAALSQPQGGELPGPVDSLLLLQPAVNHLCFADELPNGKAGGFKPALAKVKQPILSTFSSHDSALFKAFHLALRRGKDLGEVEIAADEPPSEYAALGGYGPRGFDGWKEVVIKDPTDKYDLGPSAPEVWAVKSDRRISGHGAVVNEATAWALFNLAEA